MTLRNIFCSLAAAATAAACSSPAGSGRVGVEPSPCAIVADSTGRAEQSLTFHISPEALKSRSRLVITPQLYQGQQWVRDYRPIVADGRIFAKKMTRREALEGYEDPYADLRTYVGKGGADIPYHIKAQLPAGGDGRIVAAISADGCGECTGIDTIDVATITRPQPARQPRYGTRQKIRRGQGTAHLQFVINRYEIVPDMADNRAELQRMADDIGPLMKDSTAAIHGIDICGVASADGPLAFNTTLSLNRAKSARKWLCDRLGLCEEQASLITISSRPEGWQPVIDAMQKAGHPWAERVRDVVNDHKGESDDVAESVIRKMPCWPDIRDKFLQPDRKVDYKYSYSVKGETETYIIEP